MSCYLVWLLLLLVSSIWSFSPLNVAKSRQNQGARIPSPTLRSTFSLYAQQQQPIPQTTPETETTTAPTAPTISQDFTVAFPSFRNLMALPPGEHVESDVISVQNHDFCVLLYPRGGGHDSKTTTDSGFGMSYQIFAPNQMEKVGLYLKYLGQDEEEDTVDATFSLQLVGQQATTPAISSPRRFNVEWSAGMRFVSPEKSNLKEGMANDFGAHVMQTCLLPEFLGVDLNSDDECDSDEVQVQVSITIHPSPTESTGVTSATDDTTTDSNQANNNNNNVGGGLLQSIGLQDIRLPNTPNSSTTHNTEQVRVGKIVVPVLTSLEQRPRMFQLGAYPGVEYRIMKIFSNDKEPLFYSTPGCQYELKPIYPLVKQLERPWPVRVKEQDIPKLLTPNMYNVISAVGSLFTAVAGLTTAFVISQAISLFFIPSKSMDPTLQVKDVLLVEKVTPRLTRENKVGDVVLFTPPQKLQDIVASSSGGRTLSNRDLFVKRIAATAGDTVSVDGGGNVKINGVEPNERRDLCDEEPLRLIERYLPPASSYTLDKDQVFVLGDCSSVSVDSRVWGPLSVNQIVGKPIVKLWPRVGTVPALPTTTTTTTTTPTTTRDVDWTN